MKVAGSPEVTEPRRGVNPLTIKLCDLAPSSSGPGYLVLIQKIAGSNPAGVTILQSRDSSESFCLLCK